MSSRNAVEFGASVAVVFTAIAIAVSCVALTSSVAWAHPLAPLVWQLELSPAADGVLLKSRWRESSTRVRGQRVRPLLPPDCVAQGAPWVLGEDAATMTEQTWRCDQIPTFYEVIGLETANTSLVLTLTRLRPPGPPRVDTHLMTATTPTPTPTGTTETARWIPPADAQPVGGVLLPYFGLGLSHLLAGLDHIAFVIALLLLLGWRRRLFWAISAFTVGHSVTLALATLGVVDLPQAPVELLIAASVVALALEVVTREPGAPVSDTHTTHLRWVGVCAVFGLLHGLGFAGVLSDIGLPQGAATTALVGFNLGVEAGQIAVVSGAAVAGRLAMGLGAPRWLTHRASGWVLGAVGAMWILQRF